MILVTSMGDHRNVLDGILKACNDTFGHQAGDEALQQVADILVAVLRQADGVYRYGGEQFLAILPEGTAESGIAAFERVRHSLAERALPTRAGPEGWPSTAPNERAGTGSWGSTAEFSPWEGRGEAGVLALRACVFEGTIKRP